MFPITPRACRFPRLLAMLLFLYVFLVAQSPNTATAATPTWIAGSGNWATAANWSGNAVPANGDDVFISFSGGGSRLITYDYTGPAISLTTLNIDLTGSIFSTATVDMSANALTVGSLRIGIGSLSPSDNGTFTQSGGTVAAGALTLGVNTNGKGFYNLSGTASLTVSGEKIGENGTGTFTQSGGTHIISSPVNALFIGYNPGAIGNYTLSGGSLAVTGYEILGHLGTGNMTQSGGTHTVAAGYYFSLGSGGGTGNYTLSGSAALTSNSSEYVGSNGSGTFIQTGGTNTISAGSNLIIANTGSSTGTYTLSGTGVANINSNAYVGGNENSSGGTGILNIQGGTMTIAGTLKIWNTPNSAVNLSGGSLTVGSINTSGNPLRFNWTAGTLIYNDQIFFNNGPGAPFGNVFTINANQSLIVTPTGPGGPNFEYLNTTGSITQNGGSNLTPDLSLSNESGGGSAAAYNLFSGTLTVTNATFVGSLGAGAFNQFGGTYTSQGLVIAASAGSSGTYTLTGGTTTINNLLLGGNGGTPGGAGVLTIQGGTMTVGGLSILNSPGTILNLAGGTFSVGFSNIGTNPTRFNWTGGTFNWTNASGLTIDTNGLFGASITLATNKTLASSFPLTNNGAVILVGGGLGGAGPVVNNTTISGFGIIAGSGGFTNFGLISLSGGNLIVSNTGGFINAGNMHLPAGYFLQLTGGTFNNTGTVNLNGASVTGSAAFDNNSSGTLSGSGSITSTFYNAGLVVLENGSLKLSSFTNNGIIELAGPSATLGPSGGIFNNTTIEGHGKISMGVFNHGTIEATGGTLIFASTFSNFADGTVRAATGTKILVQGSGFYTNAGLFSLVGGTIDYASQPLDNNGQISGYGIIATAGLTNNGSITFTGGTATINGPVINSVMHTITIKDQPALFTGLVTNNGIIKTTSTIATFAGGYAGSGLFISDPSVNIFQNNVTIAAGGLMTGESGDEFDFTGGTVTNHGAFQNGGTLYSSVNIANHGTFNQSGPQRWSADTTFTNHAGTATFSTNTGSSAAALLAIVVNNGNVLFASAQNIESITINNGQAKLVTGATKTNALTFAGTTNNWSGQLDLASNALVLQTSNPVDKAARVATLLSQIQSGRNNDTWTGQGITSSTIPTTLNTSLALADNADLHFTTFRGQPVDDSSLILVQARFGDATLDSKVNAFDLNLLAAHWQQQSGALWSAGDFTGDGIVNAFDLNLLASNWQFGASGTLTASTTQTLTTIPEPTSILLVLPTLALLCRRGRGSFRTNP